MNSRERVLVGRYSTRNRTGFPSMELSPMPRKSQTQSFPAPTAMASRSTSAWTASPSQRWFTARTKSSGWISHEALSATSGEHCQAHDGGGDPIVNPPRIQSPEDLASYRGPDSAKSPVLEKLRALKRKYRMAKRPSAWSANPAGRRRCTCAADWKNILMDLAVDPEFVKDP